MESCLLDDLGLGKQVHELKDIKSVFEMISDQIRKDIEVGIQKTKEIAIVHGIESLVINDVNGERTK